MPRQYFLIFILLFSFVPSIEAEGMEEGMASENTRNVVPHMQKKPRETDMLQSNFGFYKIVSGDTLTHIAKKFTISKRKLLDFNLLPSDSILKIGKKLKIPLSQMMIDAITTATYTIESGDTLLAIASKFKLKPKDLVRLNHIKSNTMIRKGKKLILPFPYVLKRLAKEKKKRLEQQRLAKLKKKNKRTKMLRGFRNKKLRVTATAYTSHRNQTDRTPFLAAWNNRIKPGMKLIAVSRDLISKYGLRNGTKVRIGGLPGYYIVKDKMNKRYRRRIDIYMGLNKRKALHWGRRSVIIHY